MASNPATSFTSVERSVSETQIGDREVVPCETGRRHCDDGEGASIESDRPTDYLRVGREMVPPQSIRENLDWSGTAWTVFVFTECASERAPS